MWRSKVIRGQQGSNCENLVNMISQAWKLGQISYVVCRCITLSKRSLLFLVEVKGHLGSTGVKLWKPCKHDISSKGSLDRSHIWYVAVPHWVQEAYCFWWRSKVIWGQQGSNCENLVNMISQARKLGQISYLVCRCATLSTRSLLFLVEVKGHLRSTGVKLWKPCKYDISRREAWTVVIFGMLLYHIEYKKPISFSQDQRSFGVIRHQIVKILQIQYLKTGKLGEISCLV